MPATDPSWINLSDRIKRELGWGMVDVEVTDDQMNDAVQEALEEFRATTSPSHKDGFMFLSLVPEQRFYPLPSYVVDVLETQRMDFTLGGGIEGTQFASYIYNYMLTGEPFDLVSYHLARDFLETLARLSAGVINYRFHTGLNGQIGYPELSSPIETDQVPDTSGEMDYDNRARLSGPVLEILNLPKSEEDILLNIQFSRTDAELINDMETGPWIHQYARACAKIILGHAYRKHDGMPGPGGGISLPGSDLISEGNEEKMQLKDDAFELKYGEEAYGIYMG